MERQSEQERLKRMQEMAESLFREEIKPNKPMTRIRHRGKIALISTLALTFFWVTVVFRINMFIDLEEQVKAATGSVEVSLQRRVNLFNNIVNAALNQATLEYELVKYVADSRKKIKEDPTGKLELDPDFKELEKFKDLIPNASLSGINALAEQYPQIKFSATYSQLITALVEIENNIIIKREFLNGTIRHYNTNIMQFPWYFIAKFTGFTVKQYHNSGVNANMPLLVPNIYKQLLPMNNGSTVQRLPVLVPALVPASVPK